MGHSGKVCQLCEIWREGSMNQQIYLTLSLNLIFWWIHSLKTYLMKEEIWKCFSRCWQQRFIGIHDDSVMFWFWRYLTRGLIWHLSQPSIKPSIYFSSIVKSRSNPFLEPTSTNQLTNSDIWVYMYLLQKAYRGFNT